MASGTNNEIRRGYAWWVMPIISAWRMGLRQECYPECKGSFTYSMRPCLKKRRRREEEKKKEEEKSK